MNLIDKSMVDCVLLERRKEPDGAGGFITSWEQGARFKAAISCNTSTEMQIAEAQGLKRVYTVTTRKTATLDYHDVFVRLSDNATFRTTSDGKDIQTPDSSTLDFSQATAERWELPV